MRPSTPVRHLDIVAVTTHACDLGKEAIWSHVIERCVLLIAKDKRFVDSGVREVAISSVRSLRTRSEARESDDPGAFATYRYMHDHRLRAAIAHNFEERFPFSWKMNWSYASLDGVLSACALALKEILVSEARLLRSAALPIITVLVDVLRVDKESWKFSWWATQSNVDYVSRRAVEECEWVNEGQLSKHDKMHVVNFCEVIAMGLRHLRSFCSGDENLGDMRALSQRVRNETRSRVRNHKSNSKKPKLHYVTVREMKDAARKAKRWAPDLYNQWMATARLGEVSLETKDWPRFENFYKKNVDAEEGSESRRTCYADSMLLDVALMFQDIVSVVKKLSVGGVMYKTITDILGEMSLEGEAVNVCAERKGIDTTILIMLMKEASLGVDLLASNYQQLCRGIVNRLQNNGLFSETSAGGAAIRPEPQLRGQPRVKTKIQCADEGSDVPTDNGDIHEEAHEGMNEINCEGDEESDTERAVIEQRRNGGSHYDVGRDKSLDKFMQEIGLDADGCGLTAVARVATRPAVVQRFESGDKRSHENAETEETRAQEFERENSPMPPSLRPLIDKRAGNEEVIPKPRGEAPGAVKEHSPNEPKTKVGDGGDAPGVVKKHSPNGRKTTVGAGEDSSAAEHVHNTTGLYSDTSAVRDGFASENGRARGTLSTERIVKRKAYCDGEEGGRVEEQVNGMVGKKDSLNVVMAAAEQRSRFGMGDSDNGNEDRSRKKDLHVKETPKPLQLGDKDQRTPDEHPRSACAEKSSGSDALGAGQGSSRGRGQCDDGTEDQLHRKEANAERSLKKPRLEGTDPATPGKQPRSAHAIPDGDGHQMTGKEGSSGKHKVGEKGDESHRYDGNCEENGEKSRVEDTDPRVGQKQPRPERANGDDGGETERKDREVDAPTRSETRKRSREEVEVTKTGEKQIRCEAKDNHAEAGSSEPATRKQRLDETSRSATFPEPAKTDLSSWIRRNSTGLARTTPTPAQQATPREDAEALRRAWIRRNSSGLAAVGLAEDGNMRAEEDSCLLNALLNTAEQELRSANVFCGSENGEISGAVPRVHVLQPPKKRRTE